jgi:hypothetical protein
MYKMINSISNVIRSNQRTVLRSLAGLMLLGVIGYASIPGEDGVIYGCYKKSGGTLRLIDRSVTSSPGRARTAGTRGTARSDRTSRAGRSSRTGGALWNSRYFFCDVCPHDFNSRDRGPIHSNSV